MYTLVILRTQLDSTELLNSAVDVMEDYVEYYEPDNYAELIGIISQAGEQMSNGETLTPDHQKRWQQLNGLSFEQIIALEQTRNREAHLKTAQTLLNRQLSTATPLESLQHMLSELNQTLNQQITGSRWERIDDTLDQMKLINHLCSDYLAAQPFRETAKPWEGELYEWYNERSKLAESSTTCLVYLNCHWTQR